jgi:hypothetical protein
MVLERLAASLQTIACSRFALFHARLGISIGCMLCLSDFSAQRTAWFASADDVY